MVKNFVLPYAIQHDAWPLNRTISSGNNSPWTETLKTPFHRLTISGFSENNTEREFLFGQNTQCCHISIAKLLDE
jgi:hypothetical protein